MKNAIVILLMVVACAGSSKSTDESKDEPWSIEVASSGGITGRGLGSLRVDSDGKLSCPGKLTDDERTRLARAVADAKPENWPTGGESMCCDRIEWTLALTIGGKTHEATWIDDPKFEMPDDLRALTRVIVDIQAAHCR